MKQNIGKTDQIIRIILGLIIAVLGIIYKSWWGVLAVIPLVTAFTGRCLLYNILGINTCPTDRKK